VNWAADEALSAPVTGAVWSVMGVKLREWIA